MDPHNLNPHDPIEEPAASKFVRLVLAMRRAQRNHQRRQTSENLFVMREAERKVDEAIYGGTNQARPDVDSDHPSCVTNAELLDAIKECHAYFMAIAPDAGGYSYAYTLCDNILKKLAIHGGTDARKPTA